MVSNNNTSPFGALFPLPKIPAVYKTTLSGANPEFHMKSHDFSPELGVLLELVCVTKLELLIWVDPETCVKAPWCCPRLSMEDSNHIFTSLAPLDLEVIVKV